MCVCVCVCVRAYGCMCEGVCRDVVLMINQKGTDRLIGKYVKNQIAKNKIEIGNSI